MAFDFPTNPVVGAVYTATDGLTTYMWNGYAWMIGTFSGSPVTETYVKKSGDNMTGALSLPGDPASSLHAATKQYVDNSITNSLTGKAVRYDVQQLLTPAEQTLARKNIGATATSYDAFAYNGMQINGSMEVSQERGAASSVLTNQMHICDGWAFYTMSAGAAFTCQTALTANWIPGLPSLLTVSVTTAKPTLAADDFISVNQFIEGYRIARLGWGTSSARPITISFWSAHSRVGTYSLSVVNLIAPSRSYVASYTQNVSGAPEYKTITIPGCTDGTWSFDNTRGLMLIFSMGHGSTYVTPSLNSWLAGGYQAAPGQVNVAETLDSFRITGVVVLPGSEAPTAAQSPLIMRPYDQELVTCQRYYQHAGGGFVGTCRATLTHQGNLSFPTMRSNPTMSFITGAGASGIVAPGLGAYDITAITASAISTKTVSFSVDTATAPPVGTIVYGFVDGWLKLDARL